MPGGHAVMPRCDAAVGHPKAVPRVGAVRGDRCHRPRGALTHSPSLRAPWGLAEGRCPPRTNPTGVPGGAGCRMGRGCTMGVALGVQDGCRVP